MSTAQLALVKRDTVDVVAEKVRQFQERGEIHFPANYSPENAMKSAWLLLQTVQDKNYKPALETCTKDSIANSLLDMVVQGLNPAKKQGYFIVYGTKLTFQRSYFGTMAVTKMLQELLTSMLRSSTRMMNLNSKLFAVVRKSLSINQRLKTSMIA